MYCSLGGERHAYDLTHLSPDKLAETELLNWLCQIFAVFGLAAGKISISLLLLAILKNTDNRWQRVYLWTFCIVLELCLSISITIFTLAQCRPAAALWDKRISGICVKPIIEADYAVFFCCMCKFNISISQNMRQQSSTIANFPSSL